MTVDLQNQESEAHVDIVSALENLKKYRLSLGESQTEFWQRFGLTQPGGSRYEGEQPIPKPTALLIGFYLEGKITDEDLSRIASSISGSDKIAKTEKVSRIKK